MECASVAWNDIAAMALDVPLFLGMILLLWLWI